MIFYLQFQNIKLMMQENTNPGLNKIIDKLFIYADNKDIKLNKRRSLIVNPEMMRILIQQMQSMSLEQKLTVWGEVSDIFAQNSLNSCILFKRDKQLLEFNHSIYDEIVKFMLSLKAKISDNQKIIKCFKPLIKGYPISCRNIKNIINKVSMNFHSQRFDSQKLQLCIGLLNILFKDQVWNIETPQSFFVMYGPHSGLRLINQNIKWSLNKGFNFYVGFEVQAGEHSQMNLLSILINEDSFELTIDQGNYLRAKFFGVTKVYTIKKLDEKKWYFLKLSYFIKSGIIRNTCQAIVHLQGDPYQIRDLPIPSLSMKDNIQQLLVGHNFFGKINIALISRQQLHSWPKYGFNTQAELQNFLTINKNKLKEIFLLYTPLIHTQFNNNDIVFDIINQHHAEILQNTTIFANPFESIDINYYGGIYNILPFFKILRFYKYEQYPTALEELMEIIVNFFILKYKNLEKEMINCQFFGILSEFFNRLNEKYFTVRVMETIKAMRELIKDKQLFRHYFLYFLLRVNISRIVDQQIVSRWLNIISGIYYRDFSWAIEVFSISQVIWYIIDNFEPENPSDCCLLHFYEKNHYQILSQHILDIKDQYKVKGNEIKLLLTYIIKQIVSTRQFQLLKKNYDIIQFLLHRYSICFNALLIECLFSGIIIQPGYFIKRTQILQTMYALLPLSNTKDQIIPILRVLNCLVQENIRTQSNLNSEIIAHIAQQLNKLYMKSYAKIRIRSKSEGIFLLKRMSERKLSVECEEGIEKPSVHYCQNKQKQRTMRNRIYELKKSQKNKLSNDKVLYQTLVDMCCGQDAQTGDLVLRGDEFVEIIAPYFKICSQKFKVKLIEIVKMSVFIKSANQNLPPQMNGLSKFDLIHRFILSQFILKELDPQDPDYQPSENLNYVMKNLYYIIDSMVNGMKNDWHSMYLYLIRIIQLLKQARKDIEYKTQRSSEQILRATKVCSRKFILRILHWAKDNIQNMSNMVFFVYLVVFNNDKKMNFTVFEYFKSLQHNFFIDKIEIINQFDHREIQSPIFIDQRIILSMVEAFDLQSLKFTNNLKQVKNQIKAYLELQQENEFQNRLFKLRDIYLSSTQFRENGLHDYRGFRGLFTSLKTNREESSQKGLGYKLYIAETIVLLVCLCIESSLQEKRLQIFKQSLRNLDLFIKSFLLSMSRDNLKKDEHHLRNKILPRNLTFHLIHFLYTLLDRELQKQFETQIQQQICSIINYSTLIMTVLCEKIGNPQNIEEVQMLSAVMSDVEYYNFFSFGILGSQVITINQIKVFSTFGQKKSLEVIHHPKIRKYFKDVPKVFIQKHIKEVVEIHRLNLEKIEKQLAEKFARKIIIDRIIVDTTEFYQYYRFQELEISHSRLLNLEYRKFMRIWRKIWKRLRLYHYYWSIGMNQNDKFDEEWKKNSEKIYKHKFSKYMHLEGLRPIMQVEPYEPWHIQKARLDQEFEYRSQNFMVNLHKLKMEKKINEKSFIDKIFRKSLNNFSSSVFWIKHNSKRKGTLKVEPQKLIFEYDSTYQKDSHVNFTPFLLAQHRPMKKTWPLVWITNIIRRRYLTKNECLLIEFEDDTALIFHFINQDTEDFLAKIEQIQLEKQNKINIFKLNNVRFYLKNFRTKNYQKQIDLACRDWCQGKITNLHYLMILNKYSGRSFLDPVNYPVVPWVIGNYDCKQFVLRDLSKTLGALGLQTRKQFYENKYSSIDPFSNVPPYQYGTHYSSPGVVFNFLVRISPYTEAAKTLQGGRFDLSDRLFSSIKVCWYSVTSEVSDVRQLLPQFYYFPQFLINIENHDFGLTQMKERIHNVKLPLWGSNPWEFITAHRRVLESQQVTLNINHWIDLIFGYKQKGKIAKDNLNLYYYLTYENSIDLNEIEDQVEKTSVQAQIIHFGQTPSQIFFKAHPETERYSKYPEISQTEKRGKGKDCHKIKFLGIIESITPIVLLNSQNSVNQSYHPTSQTLFIFKDSYLIWASQFEKLELKQQQVFLRTASKQKIYHVEDLNAMKKVQLFKNNKFIAIGSYVNGDLVIYNVVNGQKVQHQKGYAKKVIYVNQNQNLLLSGSKNGLLEVYEIVYLEKDTLKLIKIIQEYFMYPIEHISEGAGFYAFSCGNLVIISKIFRSLSYVHEKTKMQGQKMIRSLQSRRKVYGSFICTNPLYCVIFFNLLEVFVYSINGQFLKMRQIQNLVAPIIAIDDKKRQNLVVLQPSGLSMLKIPQLQTIIHVPVPKKQYTHMKLINKKLYLVSLNGEIFSVFNQRQMIWL